MTTFGTRTLIVGRANVRLAVLLCLSWSFQTAVWGTAVNTRRCSDSHSPNHITLAVGKDPSTQMIITFASTSSYVTPPPIAAVIVSHDRASIEQILSHQEATQEEGQPVLFFVEDRSDGSPTSYNVDVPKSTLANDNGVGKKYYSSYYHHVTMRRLEPATEYYYVVMYHQDVNSFDPMLIRKYLVTRRNLDYSLYDPSNQDCPSPDKIRSFRTAPKPGEFFTAPTTTGNDIVETKQRYSVNIAVMGDLGQFQHSMETASKLRESINDIDTILLAGDIAYNEKDHRGWDTFLDFLDDYEIAHSTPMQIVPGNHDIGKLVNDNNVFLGYENRFRMPRIHPPVLGQYNGNIRMDSPPYPLPYEWGNSYYSYTYGPAHIIMINSYSSIEPNSTQYEWILNDLESVDRTVTPWVLVVLHTPLYNTFASHRRDLQVLAAKQHLESLFIENNVNFVLTGHVHAYLRTSGVVYDSPDETGPIYITVGASGREIDAPFFSETKENWVEARDATYYGYGMLRILNDTVSEWEWIHSSGELNHDNRTAVSPGPKTDRVLIQNQYYL